MVGIVKVGDSKPQWLDTGNRSILPARHGDIDLFGPFKAAFDVVVDLRGTLAKIGPAMWVIGKAMVVCSFRAPDDAGTGSGWVKTSMRTVTFVCVSELAMNLRTLLTAKRSINNVMRCSGEEKRYTLSLVACLWRSGGQRQTSLRRRTKVVSGWKCNIT